MNLDLYTVVVASVSTIIVTAIAGLVLWWREKTSALRDWAFGISLAALSNFATSTQLQNLPMGDASGESRIVDFAVMLGLTGITAGYVLTLRGMFKHLGATWRRSFWLLVAVSAALYLGFMWPTRNNLAWFLTTSYSRALLCALGIWVLIRHRHRLAPWAAVMTLGPLTIQSAYMFARGSSVFFPGGIVAGALFGQSMTYLLATLLMQAFFLGLFILHIEDKLRQLEEAAGTDALTGLNNRRSFNLLARHEIDRSLRSGSPLWVLMIDLDHFKAINDQFGHLTGDQVLAHFGALLKGSVRSADIVARYGGEEFCVILPGADREQAMLLAARIHAAAASVRRSGELMDQTADDPAQKSADNSITVSIGAACLQSCDGRMEDALNRADLALYDAKRAGRNCTAGLDRAA